MYQYRDFAGKIGISVQVLYYYGGIAIIDVNYNL